VLTLNELRQGIMHLLYPRLCEGCNRQLLEEEEVLCIGCATELPETGYHAIAGNETEQRFAGRFPFVRATSYCYFTEDGLLQHLLHGLKYTTKKETAAFLGRRFAQQLAVTDWISTVDEIVAVPLHPDKEALRGYNQSHLLSLAMGEMLHKPVTEGQLVRVRATESQTNKNRAERTANMAGAFGLKDKKGMEGKHILIVDDVLTTGATIEACALAILEAAGAKVSIATIGITV
jgi:ComF family protein